MFGEIRVIHGKFVLIPYEGELPSTSTSTSTSTRTIKSGSMWVGVGWLPSMNGLWPWKLTST